MTSVTIEQNMESRQTYLRFKGLGHLLRKPQFSIASDSNEMLSPSGWKNQDIANDARQCLDGDDLLLEIDARLINHIEPGRAIEIGVAELKFAERILPPPLLSFPSGAPLPPGTKVYGFKASGGAPAEPASALPDDDQETRSPYGRMPPPPPPRPDFAAGLARELGDDRQSGDDEDEDEPGHTRLVDHDREPSGDHSSDGETRLVEDDVDHRGSDEHEARASDDEEEATEPALPPEPGRPSRLVLAAAVGVGLIVGFFGKYITDEYSPWANQSAPPQANRRIALLETDAFGPLAEDLKQVPDKSPAGLAPDAVPGIRPASGNPGRTYFNHGGQKAREGNKAEATYWYKRSVLTIEPEALTFLGDAYLNGDGVPRDARTGYQLLRMAAGFGSERARSYLMDMLASNKIPDAPPTMAEAFRGR